MNDFMKENNGKQNKNNSSQGTCFSRKNVSDHREEKNNFRGIVIFRDMHPLHVIHISKVKHYP